MPQLKTFTLIIIKFFTYFYLTFIVPRGSMNISTVMTHEDIKTAVSAYDKVFEIMKHLFD